LMALLHIVRFDSCWQSASQNPNGFWSWGTQKSRVHLPAPRFFLSPTHTLTLKEEHFVFIYTTCWVPGNSSSSSSCKSWARGVERESVKLPESGGRFQSVALSILNGHIVDSVCLCAVFVYSTTGMRAEIVGISANFLITILEMIREWGGWK
jgi:hypothetical protein